MGRRRAVASRSPSASDYDRGPRAGHRPGNPVHDVPRRRQRRDSAPASSWTPPGTPTSAARRSHPNFPTTAGRVQADRRGRTTSPTSFVTKLNAAGHGARLLDVHRRQRLRLRTADRDRRGRQRLRHRPDEVVEFSDHRRRVRPHASTSRRTARGAASTTTTGS